MTEPLEGRPVDRRQRNWWKIAFFVALIAFELAREIAVLASYRPAKANAIKTIFSTGDYVAARGSWKRSDGGSPIVPSAVTIECRKETGQCIEASVNGNDEYFFAPDLAWFSATFTPDGVSYVNDQPDCARYMVRIDTKAERAFATRDRKDNPSNKMCAKMESRVAMELGDGGAYDEDSLDKHFVPLIRIIASALKLFS